MHRVELPEMSPTANRMFCQFTFNKA